MVNWNYRGPKSRPTLCSHGLQKANHFCVSFHRANTAHTKVMPVTAAGL
jgi:hypothetical protein